ncbi:allantoicase [Pseudonocardia pini]|uniref:allantoicase n=1 Tax=Pseudonocardia pini TaxID=2758030 RepID=UPI0015F02440|nr:allantoicase [Pseudonocardia pini]
MYPDLALRTVGGSVVSATDESFAAKENLIVPGPPVFDPTTFGHRGKVYDGWETRRRRTPGHDEAVVRLGAPGIVRRIVVDTTWFTGNYPPQAAVDGRADDEWFELVPLSDLKGDSENAIDVRCDRRVTEVRLRIVPDGGVARLRVFGEALPDPALIAALGTVDLAAVENGGHVRDVSNRFYSEPQNLLLPGPARSMGEGWETARRRDSGNDWVEIGLGVESRIAVVELDTRYFLHNAPARAVLGTAGRTLVDTDVEPDTVHRIVLQDPGPVTDVRLDIHPDGGLSRVRLWGTPTEAGRQALQTRWHQAH